VLVSCSGVLQQCWLGEVLLCVVRVGGMVLCELWWPSAVVFKGSSCMQRCCTVVLGNSMHETWYVAVLAMRLVTGSPQLASL
jgi:hypothetical protein